MQILMIIAFMNLIQLRCASNGNGRMLSINRARRCRGEAAAKIGGGVRPHTAAGEQFRLAD